MRIKILLLEGGPNTVVTGKSGETLKSHSVDLLRSVF
jgi:hypothetical protein